MNERIKELAGQLGPIATIGNWGRVEWADNVYPQLGDRLYAAIDLEKFAELIVRDCISQIAMIGVSNCENNDVGWTVDKSIENIRKNFGVEE